MLLDFLNSNKSAMTNRPHCSISFFQDLPGAKAFQSIFKNDPVEACFARENSTSPKTFLITAANDAILKSASYNRANGRNPVLMSRASLFVVNSGTIRVAI
jgi:hypothetical protein